MDNELKKRLTLNRLAFIAGLREMLTHLREGKISDAIALMEFSLDCETDALVEEVKGCDQITKDLGEGELKRLKQYRSQHPEDEADYLSHCKEESERAFCLKMRSSVEAILNDLS
jgi:hypothetical protein